MADAATDHPGDAACNHPDAEDGKPEHQRDRLHLGVEIVEIGAGTDEHIPAGDRNRIGKLANQLVLSRPAVFVAQRDFAILGDAVAQFAHQLPAAGIDVHAVLADLAGNRRQHGDAVHRVGEHIAVAIVEGQRIAALAELGNRRLLGHLARGNLLLQPERHVARHVDDRPGLLDPRIQHLTLHQIARKHAGDAEAEQGHAQQNAELGGDLEVGELHGDLRKIGAWHAIGRLIWRTVS